MALAVSAQPGTADSSCTAHIADARAAYERQAYTEARAQFTEAVTVCGATPPLLLALAQAELLSRDVEAALATLAQLEALGPLSVAALKVRARALYLVANDRDAELTLLSAASRDPGDAELAYDLGRIYYQQQRHQDAHRAFERATTLDPRSYKAWDNLGLACEALGDEAAAVRHYAPAMAIAQTDAPAYDVVYANYADLLLRQGEFQRAFDAAAEAAQRNPRDPRNLLLAGKALLKLEATDAGVKWLTQAVTLDPDYPEPHYLLARAYRVLGRPNDARRAMEAFQTASARAPQVRR